MDQARFLMWSKSRSWINLRSQPSLFGSSWEEQAFAEDTLHIWPPRSYSCTFCRREFRSAQALGGHMNVHRRDRARLRQQPPSSPGDQSKSNTPSDDGGTNLSPYNYYLSSAAKEKPPKDQRGGVVNSTHDQVFVPDLTLVVGNLKRKNCVIDEFEDAVTTKRRCVGLEFPLFARSTSPIELQQLRNEVKNHTSSPIEELDLELRLGNSPKVK